MKKRFLLLSTLVLGMCQIMPVYADESTQMMTMNAITPYYNNIILFNTNIIQSNGEVVCGTNVTLRQVGDIDVTMKLQRKISGKWETIKTWNDSKTAKSLNCRESVALSDINNLRVYSTVTVTVEGSSETATDFCTL